jgi:hypothetical protein
MGWTSSECFDRRLSSWMAARHEVVDCARGRRLARRQRAAQSSEDSSGSRGDSRSKGRAVDNLRHKEQLYFLEWLQIPSGLQVTNSRTNSNLNLPWLLKGCKPFWKNLINSIKFHHHIIYLNMNLDWLTCIQILDVPLHMGKDSLFHTQKSWPLKYIASTITSTSLYQTGQGVF